MGRPEEAVTRLQHCGPGGSGSGSNARDIIHVEWHPTDKVRGGEDAEVRRRSGGQGAEVEGRGEVGADAGSMARR